MQAQCLSEKSLFTRAQTVLHKCMSLAYAVTTLERAYTINAMRSLRENVVEVPLVPYNQRF